MILSSNSKLWDLIFKLSKLYKESSDIISTLKLRIKVSMESNCICMSFTLLIPLILIIVGMCMRMFTLMHETWTWNTCEKISIRALYGYAYAISEKYAECILLHRIQLIHKTFPSFFFGLLIVYCIFCCFFDRLTVKEIFFILRHLICGVIKKKIKHAFSRFKKL